MPHDPKKLLPSIFNRDYNDYVFRLPTVADFESIFKNERGEQGLNVYEEKDNFIVEAAVPGLQNEEIDINIHKGVLWIKGEKKETEEDKEKKYYRKSYNSFSYSVALPEQIDDREEPEASYDNGVLKVVFKKAKNASARKIAIKNDKKTS
jgi:HSP20 family protein